MRITVKQLEEQINLLNDYLSDDCIYNISVRLEKPTKSNYPGITILKDNSILTGDKISYENVHRFTLTKTELFFCLGRAMKILSVMEYHNKNMMHFISDMEIVMIFNAAFWR